MKNSAMNLVVCCLTLFTLSAHSVTLTTPNDQDKQPATATERTPNQPPVIAKTGCTNGEWGCGDDWQLSLSVPALKFRQGEQVQVFQGLAIGLQLNNLFLARDSEVTSIREALVITPALMMSTEKTLDSTTGNTKSDYVFAAAILFGIRQGKNSFQIGWAYDMVSSESPVVLKSRPRTSILFNVGTGF